MSMNAPELVRAFCTAMANGLDFPVFEDDVVAIPFEEILHECAGVVKAMLVVGAESGDTTEHEFLTRAYKWHEDHPDVD